MFSHRLRYLFIGLLALYTFLNTELCNVYHYFDIDIEWYYAFLTILLITGFAWEGNRLLEPVLQKRIQPDKNKWRYLGAFFIAGNAIASLAAIAVVYFIGNVLHGYSWRQNVNPLKLNIIYVSLVNLFFHLVNAIFFFFREYRRQWVEAEELRRSSVQAQLEMVKSQINPHFLFNNLNVLSGMVIKDNPEANKFIEEFSKVYRYILNNQQKELVELRSELEFIQPYIFLLKKRFNEGLVIEVNVADKYKNFYVVPAALQMLIENAIKHNVVSQSRPLYIDIHSNGSETLVVKNNLQPRTVNEPSGRIGLQNIRRRYEIVSGRDVNISQSATTFEVTLPLLNLN
ncbi:MAG TPA: histidine kinase [Chitinophagaceae bacterium]|nr:histidine kinase [Chitinophagaceae bacterium]